MRCMLVIVSVPSSTCHKLEGKAVREEYCVPKQCSLPPWPLKRAQQGCTREFESRTSRGRAETEAEREKNCRSTSQASGAHDSPLARINATRIEEEPKKRESRRDVR